MVMKREVMDIVDVSGLDSIDDFKQYGKWLGTPRKPVKKFKKERDEFVKKSKQRKTEYGYAYAI